MEKNIPFPFFFLLCQVKMVIKDTGLCLHIKHDGMVDLIRHKVIHLDDNGRVFHDITGGNVFSKTEFKKKNSS